MLEKSLLVRGQSASMVSIIAAAVIHLIAPLKWVGAFIPLLPLSAKEVLQAPVPFVIGVVNYTIDENVDLYNCAVLNLDELVDLKTMLHLPTFEPAFGTHLQSVDGEEIDHNISSVRNLLFSTKKRSCSCNLNVFRLTLSDGSRQDIVDDKMTRVLLNHILFHLTENVIIAISRAFKSIERRNRYLLDDLYVTDRWKRFGTMEFLSGMYIAMTEFSRMGCKLI